MAGSSICYQPETCTDGTHLECAMLHSSEGCVEHATCITINAMMRNLDERNWREAFADPSILHPQVKASYGGGLAPEQHFGYLITGHPFYFRARYSYAMLQLGPVGKTPDNMRIVNEHFSMEDAAVAYAAGEEYAHTFWMNPSGRVNFTDEEYAMEFNSEQQREDVFAECLRQALEQMSVDGFTWPE